MRTRERAGAQLGGSPMAEALALQRKLHKLCSCLDPVVLSTALFSNEIIDDRAWEEARSSTPNYDRCLKLLEFLIRKVKARPFIFEQFCTILEEEVVTVDIAAELKELQKYLKNEADAQHKKAKNDQADAQDKKTEDDQADAQDKKTEDDQADAQDKKAMKEDNILASKKEEDNIPASKKEDDSKFTRKRQQNIEETLQPPKKRQQVVKSSVIDGDKVLLDIGWEIGDKWNEVGLALNLSYKVLNSMLSSLASTTPDHMKAFRMLQEWKGRAAENYTYKALASALKENGLGSCALKFCYMDNFE